MRSAIIIGSALISQAIRPEMFESIALNLFVAGVVILSLVLDMAELQK